MKQIARVIGLLLFVLSVGVVMAGIWMYTPDHLAAVKLMAIQAVGVFGVSMALKATRTIGYDEGYRIAEDWVRKEMKLEQQDEEDLRNLIPFPSKRGSVYLDS